MGIWFEVIGRLGGKKSSQDAIQTQEHHRCAGVFKASKQSPSGINPGHGGFRLLGTIT
jgi:hypothetical protein